MGGGSILVLDKRELSMHPGLIGGILGSVLGTLGGIIGTYFSIKNTKGPKERAFVVRCVLIDWVFIVTFLAGIIFIPQPYNHLMWIPYGLVLSLGIRKWNKEQMRIREKESA